MLAYKGLHKRDLFKALWLVAAVIFLHFAFVDISGFPLTPAPFAVVVFIFASYKFRFSSELAVSIWAFLLALPFLNLLFPGVPVGHIEFIRTYLLWVFAVTAVLVALTASIRFDSSWVSKAAFVSLLILALYSLAQVVLHQYLSLDVLYYPFGDHQYRSAEYLTRYPQYMEEGKAPGFYLEPSYNAFVITSMLFITLIGNYRPNSALILGCIALLATKAFSGIVIYGFLLIGYVAMRRTKKQLVVGIAVLLSFIVVALLLGLHEYVWARLTQVSEQGTSTYYRIVAPLRILSDILASSPTGLPFGTIEEVVRSYALSLAGQQSSGSLDNSLYVLIYYFGWIGIAAVDLIILAGIFLNRGWSRTSELYLLGYILLSLFYNGSLVAPEYAFVVVLIIYVWRANRASEVQLAGRGSADPGLSYKRVYAVKEPNESL